MAYSIDMTLHYVLKTDIKEGKTVETGNQTE